MMQTRITYKKGEEWLYDYVHSHSSPCGWVKDVLKKEYNNEKCLKSCENTDQQFDGNITSIFDNF